MNITNDQCCCHCGQAHKEGQTYSIIIDDEVKTMCCPGCQAVACLIAQSKNKTGEDEKKGGV